MKNKFNYKNKKTNPPEESNSITYTVQGTIIETDIDDKKTQPILSNEASEKSIPTSPTDKISSDDLSLSSFHHSRRASPEHNDVDFISNNESQLIQSIRVTRMLVLVSTCFLILNAPAHLCVIALKIYTGIESQVYSEHVELDHFKQTTNLTNNQLKNFVFIQTNNNTMNKNENLPSHDMDIVDDQILIHLFYIAVLLTQLISYASYSINFFLYSYSGISFRTSLRHFFNKFRKH